MNLQHYRDSYSQHGAKATLYHAAYRAANHVTRVAVWNALVITPDRVDAKLGSDPKAEEGRLLGADEMRRFATPESQLTDTFLDEAATRGDRCFAFFEGDRVVSYGWYSIEPTRLSEVADDLVLHFSPAYVYMHNGYTAPSHRGKRLHAIGMAAALRAYAKEGHKGLVSYVDSSNFPSLKSCERLGYLTVGHIILVKMGKQYLCRSTLGCKPYDLYVEQTSH